MSKKQFADFIALPDAEKTEIFERTEARLGIPPRYVEKDFWICFVLRTLYNRLPADHPRLLFKGGTTLAKVFGLVERFSEDVDLTVYRDQIGFGPGRDPTDTEGLSNSKRKNLFEELKQACGAYMRNDLSAALTSLLGEWCDIAPDDGDVDGQTLLVKYPTLYPGAASDYVRPEVKLEGGARSALVPNTTASTTPYIGETLGDDWSLAADNLLVIEPTRTHLDKLLILHATHCGYRDRGRLPKDDSRISRHYYDVAMLAQTEAGKAALADKALLDDVRKHAEIAFPSAWRRYDEAVPGSFRLVPQDGLRAVLERDFAAMQEMIFGDIPSFDWITERIQAVEQALNRR